MKKLYVLYFLSVSHKHHGCIKLNRIEEAMLNEIADDKFREETQFGGSAGRIGSLVDYLPHVSEIASLLGATPPYLKMLLTDPALLLKVLLGPATVTQFRLRGPDAKPCVATSTIKNYPPIPMRRVTYIALSLYILSMVTIAFSLIVPITFEARKSLQPVGFPQLRNRPLQVVRYILFWIHAVALAYFYSTTTKISNIGSTIVVMIGIFEMNGFLEQRKRKESLRELLTSSAEIETRITFDKVASPPKRSCSTASKPGILTMLGVVMFGVAFVAKAQLAFGLHSPSDMRYLAKKQRGQNIQSLLTTSGGSFLTDLSETHNFSALERVAVMSRGNLQDFLSTCHLQQVNVLINRFDLVLAGEDADVGASPAAIYDREVDISISDRLLCKASSKVMIYDTKILEAVSSNQVGIGQLLKIMKLYPEFTLHDAGRNENGGIWRFYSLDCNRLIGFDILEEFTHDAFCDGNSCLLW